MQEVDVLFSLKSCSCWDFYVWCLVCTITTHCSFI